MKRTLRTAALGAVLCVAGVARGQPYSHDKPVPPPSTRPAPPPYPPAPARPRRRFHASTSSRGDLKEYYVPIDVQVGARAGVLYLSDRGDLATTLAPGGGVTLAFGAASYLAPLD